MAEFNQSQIKDFFQLTNLADEFAKIGIRIQFPKISDSKLKEKLIEKRNLNNIQERWERLKLLKKS